jgi:hypothetical protein
MTFDTGKIYMIARLGCTSDAKGKQYKATVAARTIYMKTT